IENRLIPSFSDAALTPCAAACSIAAAFCDGVYRRAAARAAPPATTSIAAAAAGETSAFARFLFAGCFFFSLAHRLTQLCGMPCALAAPHTPNRATSAIAAARSSAAYRRLFLATISGSSHPRPHPDRPEFHAAEWMVRWSSSAGYGLGE